MRGKRKLNHYPWLDRLGEFRHILNDTPLSETVETTTSLRRKLKGRCACSVATVLARRCNLDPHEPQ